MCVCEREGEDTCGGFMIAQKWSTGNIPKFEMLREIEDSVTTLQVN